jgi:hypothetical protein
MRQDMFGCVEQARMGSSSSAESVGPGRCELFGSFAASLRRCEGLADEFGIALLKNGGHLEACARGDRAQPVGLLGEGADAGQGAANSYSGPGTTLLGDNQKAGPLRGSNIPPRKLGSNIPPRKLAPGVGLNMPPRKPGVNIPLRKPGVNIPLRKPGVNIPPRKPGVVIPPRKPGVNLDMRVFMTESRMAGLPTMARCPEGTPPLRKGRA